MESITASQMIGGNPEKKRSATDFYPTPDEVTETLIYAIQPNPETTNIWEPACGDGRMVRCLERIGPYEVVGTDISTGHDFLKINEVPDGCNWIITNPPFSLAEEFIRHAHELNIPFAFLLKSQLWHAKKRYDLFTQCPPDYIFPLTWRPDFLFGASSGAPLMDVMWCVWLRNSRYPLTRYVPLKKHIFNEVNNE